MKRIAILLILFFGYSGLNAQDSLSLKKAIAIGLERNFDISIVERQVEKAVINNNPGEAGRYPTVDLTLNQSNSTNNNIEVAFPQFQPTGTTGTRSWVPGAQVSWMVFDGFRVNIAKDRLENLQAETEGNASIVIANTVQAVILGYYLVVLEKERLEVFERNLILSRDKYQLLKLRKDLGSAVTSDLLLEEGNYLSDSTNYMNQELLYRNALRNLNFILAEEDPNTDYLFANGLEFDHPDYTLQALLEKLNADNIDLRKQYITQQIAKQDVRLSKSERYPTVNLNLGISQTWSRQNLSDVDFGGAELDDIVNTESRLMTGSFGVSFRLFDGGKINRAIQRAVVNEDIANIEVDKLKTSLYRDLASAHDRYQILKQLYGINVRRREAAQQNLDISSEKYRSGTINSFDFRNVQNRLLLAEIDMLQSLYNLIEGNVNILRLTGGITEIVNQ